MKTLPLIVLPILVWTSQSLCASSIMLNFRSTSANAAASGDVASPYLTLSPGHGAGAIPLAETNWNNFSSTGTINLGNVTGINTSALYGTGGGTAGRQVLVGNAASIYGSGNTSSNSAVSRAGWIGGGTAAAGNALGLRLDGLAAGDYRIYLMGRNTNTNAATAAPMNLYTTTGATSSSFNFSALTAAVQSNITYTTANPTAYNTFTAGENFVSFDITLSTGDSLFLAADGGSAGETRGFLNMIQIVSVPEPSSLVLGFAGLLTLSRRRR